MTKLWTCNSYKQQDMDLDNLSMIPVTSLVSSDLSRGGTYLASLCVHVEDLPV